jgi:pimeloyl-ACP methyl ester carboxylesterase
MSIILRKESTFLLLLSFLFINKLCFAANTPIHWKRCGINPGFQCTSIAVPEDYNHPKGKTISIAVAKHSATDIKLGTLVFNTGGPWNDDTASIQYLFSELSDPIKKHFDLIGFAPRGVGSNPITCHTDQVDAEHKIEKDLNLTYMNSEAGAQLDYESILKKRNLCQYDSLSQYAYTKNTVHDLDEIRQALNINQIDYFGGSYGTRLGLAYLVTYPEHVDRMVLDANLAPNNNSMEYFTGIAPAIESTLHHFIDQCAESGNKCALYRGSKTETLVAFEKLIKQAETTGIPTSATYKNQPLSAQMLMYIIISALGEQSAWPDLAAMLNQTIINNNADIIMKNYSAMTTYDPGNDTFKNYNDAAVFDSVFCTDYIVPNALQKEQTWLATMRNLRKQNPLVGGMWSTYCAKECIQWPEKSNPLLPAFIKPFVGSKPKILLISNSYDNITPAKWSHEVSAYLDKINMENKVLTWEGSGHIAYHANAPLNGCIDTTVDKFLVTGVLPVIDSCNDKINPFEDNAVKHSDKKWLRRFL